MAKEKDDSYKAPHDDKYYVGAEPRADDAGSFKHDNRNKPHETSDGPVLDNVSVEDVNAKTLEVQKKNAVSKKSQQPNETNNSSQINS